MAENGKAIKQGLRILVPLLALSIVLCGVSALSFATVTAWAGEMGGSGVSINANSGLTSKGQNVVSESQENDATEWASVSESTSASLRASTVASGTWGTCTWDLDSDGLLTIHAGQGVDIVGDLATGGKANDWIYFPDQPWSEVRDDIQSVIFERGVVLPEDCHGLLAGCHNAVSVDFSGCDASHTKTMRGLLLKNESLERVTLGNIDTSHVTDMSFMFCDCEQVSFDHLERLNTFFVTDMSGMFTGWKNIDLAIEDFDTSSVTDMSAMFREVSGDIDLDLSHWDVSNVASMRGMFNGTELRSLDISGWNAKSLPDDGNVFEVIDDYERSRIFNSSNIEKLVAEGASFPDLSALFAYSEFRSLDLSSWDVSRSYNFNEMFIGCHNLENVNLNGWDTSSATSMTEMFSGCSSLTSVHIEDWDVSSVRYFAKMFKGCSSLTVFDLSKWDVSNVKSTGDASWGQKASGFASMFEGCTSLETLKLFECDTRSENSTYRMFYGCTSLKAIDFTQWDTANIINCKDAFKNCSSLSEVKVGKRFVMMPCDDAPMFPEATSENGEWWSVNNQAWYTRDSIASDRSNTEDTYTNWEAKSLSGCTMTLSPSSYTYDGNQKKPTVTLKYGSTTLKEGSDYTLSWPSGRVNVGTYTVTATGKGSYIDTKSATFTIERQEAKSLSSCTMTLSPSSYTYDGSQKKPAVTLKDGSTTLAEGTDYTISWSSGRTDAGTYSVTATGKGNYADTKSASFTISQATPTLTFASSSVSKKTTDSAFTNALTKTTDGIVTFSSNSTNVATVNNSTGQVTIKGEGTATITASASAGKNYKAGSASYSINVTKPTTYTISYNANGGTGTPSSQTKEKGVALTLSSIVPTKTYVISYNSNGGSVSPASKSVSCTFKGWNTDRDGGGTAYASGSTYTADADVTLYAQWTNPTVGTLATPTRSGYDFAGWYTSATGGTKVSTSTTMTANMTVYAHWTSASNPYNLGEETYSFTNYGDYHAGGHCFGMAMTSAGYYNDQLDIGIIGGTTSTPLYSFSDTQTVKQPICYYQDIQGSYAQNAIVAGGSYDLSDYTSYDIASDWSAVVSYVKNHEYDGLGLLELGYWKRGRGGHSVDFLRYERVDGQDRLYAYDNNFPTQETYFYRNSDGNVLQAPVQTISGSIDSIELSNVKTYFGGAGRFDVTRVIYVAKDAIAVEGLSYSDMKGENPGIERVMYELPDSQGIVTLIPTKDNADFVYLDTEYSFGKITDGTRGELRLVSSTERNAGVTPVFTIYEADSEIPSATLSETSRAYDGKQHTPKVEVRLGNVTLKETQDYVVEYPVGMKDVGEYEIKVVLTGEYNGEIFLTYCIVKGKQSITAADKSVAVGETASIGASTSGDGKLSYKSADTGIATVDASGRVRGVSAGTTKVTITASETDTYESATKSVTVKVTAATSTGAKWSRLAGNGRYDTMAAIVREGFTSSEWAVVATGKEFPDALVAASLAGAKGCPVILTAPTSLSKQAKSELEHLGVKHVYVMGGAGAVSDHVRLALSDMNISSERISGSSRYATSLAAMKAIEGLGAFDGTVVVTTGTGYADALSIGPWCYRTATPMLLANKSGKLSEAQATYCKGKVKKLIIVGGTAAVSDEVATQLGLGKSAVTRLAGSNRFATSKAIAEWECGKQGMTMANVAVATGDNFPDALAGASLCGTNASPLLLVRNEKSATLELVNKSAGIKTGYVLGGEGAVSAAIMSKLESLTK